MFFFFEIPRCQVLVLVWHGMAFVSFFKVVLENRFVSFFKVVLENRHPCWMEDFPKHVSSWRYEQEDEWNEFLERTDTSKVEFLCLEG